MWTREVEGGTQPDLEQGGEDSGWGWLACSQTWGESSTWAGGDGALLPPRCRAGAGKLTRLVHGGHGVRASPPHRGLPPPSPHPGSAPGR